MMLSYGLGRFGCHFSGDGDWGIANFKPILVCLIGPGLINILTMFWEKITHQQEWK
jgi:hypothetical protein